MSLNGPQFSSPPTERIDSAARGVGILGATGYTGAELVRLLLDHPQARLVAMSARQFAGKKASEAFYALGPCDIVFDGADVDPANWRARGVEVVFACLPHGAFAARAEAFLRAGIAVIDLSADFRLRDQAAYAAHYQWEHPHVPLLAKAHYGLCEWAGPAPAVTQASSADAAPALIANPGCYATAILLGLLPAAAAGWLGDAPVVIQAISGVSGAGRSPKLGTLLGEAGNSVGLYKVGQTHQHLGEVGEMLGRCMPAQVPSQTQTPKPAQAPGKKPAQESGQTPGKKPAQLPPLVFNPHLAPMARGILASMAVPLRTPKSAAEAQALYDTRYAQTPFVQVLQGERLCETRFVRGSNRCDIAVRVVADGHMLLVFSAIDNLLKGAAGQAVQNFNLISGFPETLGLSVGGIACI